jgi:hypothetical protein
MKQQCVTFVVGPTTITLAEKINNKINDGWLVKTMIEVKNVVVVLFEKKT